jgi:hypothetical protein
MQSSYLSADQTARNAYELIQNGPSYAKSLPLSAPRIGWLITLDKDKQDLADGDIEVPRNMN